jgi:hypothetical protein
VVNPNDIAQLRQMRERGEISDEEYEALRRHVLWGAPLPELGQSDEPDDLDDDLPEDLDEPTSAHPMPDAVTEWSPVPPAPPSLASPPLGPASGAHPAVSPLGPASGAHPAVSPLGPAGGEDPAAPPMPDPTPAPGAPGWGESWWHPDQAPNPPSQPAGQVPGPSPQPAGQVPGPPPQPASPPPQPTGLAPGLPLARAGPVGRRHGWPGRTAILLSAGLAVLLIGTGVWWFVVRSTGVAPGDYAQAVCARVQSWHDDVTTKSGELQQALNTNTDLRAVRTNLGSFFDQMASRTEVLQHDLDSVGTPDVSDGSGYQATLDRRLSDTTSTLRDAARHSRGLQTRDRSGFAIAVQALQAQVDQTISGVTDSLASTATPAELRTAYSNTGNCAPFTG